MDRQNKKESVAALHKLAIMGEAEKLFLAKGVFATTIDDISKAAAYSRRTIYAYFSSKDEILQHIILRGLTQLHENLIEATHQPISFIAQYKAICEAMKRYHENSPQSASSINQMISGDVDIVALPDAAIKIFKLGTDINNLLAGYIEQGKQQGIVRSTVEPMKTVYIMWGSISALISLTQTKGSFLEKELDTTKDAFLAYGFKQIINSILETHMRWE